MFEISFGELLVIGAVALVVLGPERLPVVARTLGALVGRARRFVDSVKTDIHNQTAMAGLYELKQEIQDAGESLRGRIEAEVSEVRQVLEAPRQDVEQALAEVAEPVRQAEADAAALIADATPDAAADAEPVDDKQLDLFSAPADPPADRIKT